MEIPNKKNIVVFQIDHKEYPTMLRKKTRWEVRAIMNDAFNAERANPTGEKAGYYLDEINYCCNELRRRDTTPQVVKMAGRTLRLINNYLAQSYNLADDSLKLAIEEYQRVVSSKI